MDDRQGGEGRVVVVGDSRAAAQIAAVAASTGLEPTVLRAENLTAAELSGVTCVIATADVAGQVRTLLPGMPLVAVTPAPDDGAGSAGTAGPALHLEDLTPASLRVAMTWASEAAVAERREASFRQVLTVVARTNRAVLEAEGPADFLDEACRIAVDVGGFALAWIGYAHSGASHLSSVASAGAGQQYVAAVRIPLGPDAPVGPTLQAIRSQRPDGSDDILADPRMAAWHDLARDHGLRSSVALPIQLADGTRGALSVYANVTGAFDDAAVDLLSQLAEDIAAGVEVLSERERRQRATQFLADTAEVLDLIAGGEALDDSLAAVGMMVARLHPGSACQVMRIAPGGQHLLPGGDPSLPAISALQAIGEPLDPSLPWVRALHDGHAVRVRTEDGTDRTLAEALGHDGVAVLDAIPVLDPAGRPIAVVIVGSNDSAPELPNELVAAATRLVRAAIGAADIEERRSHEALTDPLTGLGNRALFLDRVGHSLETSERSAVVMVDLDRFRLVNESLGPDAGHRVLVGVAERLLPLLSPGATLARLGGDEFGVLLPHPGEPVEVATLARRMTEAVAQPLDLGGEPVAVTGSVGIAFAPPATSAAELLTNAEVAMYRSKGLGGDRVELFDDELRSQAGWWMKVQAALHQVLGEAGAQLDRERMPSTDLSLDEAGAGVGVADATFTVLYQPEFRIDGSTLVGAEALSRLHTTALGDVPPDRFISVAAAAPALAAALFAVVVDDACRQVAAWRRHQPDAWVAVNITASQLIDGRLIPTAREALERHGVDPSALCLEVTETDVMREVERSLSTLQELDQLGIQIAIDDFGTGYSSLSYAKRLPVRWLKIDREFVAGLGENPSDSAIVAAAVAMGHSLGLRVTAEGVETTAQLEALRALGCDLAQGFLLGRPMPAAAVGELFAAELQRRVGREEDRPVAG